MKWHTLAFILGASLGLCACSPTIVENSTPAVIASPPSQVTSFTHPCSKPFALPREVNQLAVMPFALQEKEEQPFQLIPLGEEQATAVANSLQPTLSLCAILPSPEISAVLEQAGQLHQQGNDKKARELFRTSTLQTSDSNHWRQGVRDRLDLAEAMAEIGGNPQDFLTSAKQLAQGEITREVNELSASLAGAQKPSSSTPDTSGIAIVLSLAYDAGILGLDDLQAQANQLATQMGEQMLAAELEDFDPCQSDKNAIVRLLNAESQAYLLGVQGMEVDEPFYNQIRARITKSMNHQYNDLIRKRGLSPSLMLPEEPCHVRGSLEVRIFSVCSQQWSTIGRIEFEGDEDAVPMTLTGQGHISFSEHRLIEGELDCSISIDADVALTGAFRNDQGVQRIEFTPQFSSDGHYQVTSKTTGAQSSGIYPFNGFGSFIMPWVDGSVFPPSENHIIQYALSFTTGE
ncbi:hypothetical protein [Anaerolinea sp.]|uniref:hypothetical protein n=1 Tax=Anaerolinea sp. TaxID=1872519 RepID=UPI002ACEAD54|nr:hypothetical protein [Anaerolinea sp.]